MSFMFGSPFSSSGHPMPKASFEGGRPTCGPWGDPRKVSMRAYVQRAEDGSFGRRFVYERTRVWGVFGRQTLPALEPRKAQVKTRKLPLNAAALAYIIKYVND